MTTPQVQAWLDQKDRQVSMLIRQYGCYIKYVFGETELETPFAYSVGFFGLGHPELLMFGADEETTSHVINTLFERVQDGDDLTPGELVTFDEWPHRVLVEPVPNPAEILRGAYRHYW